MVRGTDISYYVTPISLAPQLSRAPMEQLFVIDFTGSTTVISVSLSTATVSEIKSTLQSRLAIPVHEIQLVYASQHLEDGQCLQSYGIKRHSTIHLLLSLPGGGDTGAQGNELRKACRVDPRCLKFCVLLAFAPVYLCISLRYSEARFKWPAQLNSSPSRQQTRCMHLQS